MPSIQPIKIVIADDNIFFRSGFKTIMLSQFQGEIEFIAEASSGRELIQTTREYHPDVVITDIRMPDVDGIEACKMIKQENPQIGVIAFSMFDNITYVMGMLQSGASGFLVKTSPKEEFIDAIHSIHNDNFYYCSAISDKIYGTLLNSREKKVKKKKIEFSAQENKVIQLICKQYSTKEIAVQMNLSTRTIDHYREHILEKIGAKNVVGIAIHAIANDIITYNDIARN